MADQIGRRVGEHARVLDYGCGEGQLIAAARERGHDIYGCDNSHGAWAGWADRAAHEERILRLGDDGRIPFPDSYFDIVIANQVFEHIDELDRPLFEIHRVLKPGGVFLNCFPTMEIWWEGHIKAPFAHRFFSPPKLWQRYLITIHSLLIQKERVGTKVVRWKHHFT